MLKKLETGSITIALLGLLFKFLHWPGGSMMLIMSLGTLSMYYFMLVQRMPGSTETEETDVVTALLVKIIGFALSIAAIGIMFKMQSYPGASLILYVGVGSLALLGILTMLKYNKTRSPYLWRMFIRIVAFGSVAALLVAFPRETWLEMRHADHPAYVQAVKDSWADPNNEDLLQKVDEERAKIFGHSPETLNDSPGLSQPEEEHFREE